MAELPEPWHTAAERAGVRQTYRGIGEKAGTSHVTVRRLIAEGRTSPATIRKVAQALNVDSATIHTWAGLAVSEWGPWDPPEEAQFLNPRARAALEELIRAVTQGGQHEDWQSEAEKTPVTTQDDVTQAAHRGRSHGKLIDEAHQRLGEESQDPGGMDPA